MIPLVAADDTLSILSVDASNQNATFIHCQDADCSSVVSHVFNNVDKAAMELGADGFPRLLTSFGTDTNFIVCGDAGCSSTTTTSINNTDNMNSVGVTMAPDGFARLAYASNDAGTTYFRQCTNANCSASTETNLGMTLNNVGTLTMLIGSDSYARIYSGPDETFIRCQADDCSTNTVTNGLSGDAMSMGSDDLPQLENQTGGYTTVAKCTDIDCNTADSVAVDNGSNYQSIAIGDDGYARLAYIQDINGTQTLRYARVSADVTVQDGNSIGASNARYGQAYLQAANLQTASSTALNISGVAGNTVFNVDTVNLQTTINGSDNSYNTAAATLYVGMDSNTNRSINAAGSINAIGADYAEWIPWSGDKPAAGSIVSYQGSSYVVSSKLTAAFVGNDVYSDEAHSLLVTFAGQVPVLVTGVVRVGDLLVSNGDGTARAVSPSKASLGDLLGKLAIAQESSDQPGAKHIKAAVGSAGASQADMVQAAGSDSPANLNVSGTATINDLTVSGSATIADLTVSGSAKFNGAITVGGHIITAGDQPSSQVLEAAGQGATVVVDGNDSAGTITITTGASGLTAGDLAKIIFSKTYGQAPRIIISGQNGSSASSQIYPANKTATDFRLHIDNAPQPNTSYVFDYFIVQ